MRLLEPMGERDVGELVGMVDSGCLAHGEGKREDVPRRLPGKEFDRLGFELLAIIFIDLVEKDIVVDKHGAAFMPFLKDRAAASMRDVDEPNGQRNGDEGREIGRASCRERVCQYV